MVSLKREVLDNMEVPNPLHHNNYVNSKLSNSDVEEPSYSNDRKCISSYDVNNQSYNSESAYARENKKARKDQFSPLSSDSNPYITPKFHLRRKEELPSVTPHWSNNKGIELKETVPTILNNEEFGNTSFGSTHSFIRSGGGSSRINSYTNSQTGPYTPPQFFFSPQKYMEKSKRKEEILVSIDNNTPPSLQRWANQKPIHTQDDRELQDFTKNVEKEQSVQRLREQRVKDNHKMKMTLSEPRSKQFYNNERYNKSEGHRGLNSKMNTHEKSQTNFKNKSKDFKHNQSKTKPNFSIRGNQENMSSTSIKRYKKLHNKSSKDTSTANANESWRQALDHKLNEKLKSEDVKKLKQVYGNDNWRQKSRTIQKQERGPMTVNTKETDSNKNVFGNETWKNSVTVKVKESKKTAVSEQAVTKPKKYHTANQPGPRVQNQKVQEKNRKDPHPVSMSNHQNDRSNDDEDEELIESDNVWNDIEPYLPSFLSTAYKAKVKEQNKLASLSQQAKRPEKEKINKKTEEAKSKGSMAASVDSKPKEGAITKAKRAYRCFFNPVSKNKNNEESISLFKHFQTRSKMLRKQHSMLNKKKADVLKNPKRTLSARNVINYYISKCESDENDNETEKKEEQSFRTGTVCDIDDDGFKINHSNLEVESEPFWQSGNRQRIDSLFGCDELFSL